MGFFIFHESNSGRIDPKEFKDAYDSYVDINSGITPP